MHLGVDSFVSAVTDPATGEHVDEVPEATATDVDTAVAAAAEALLCSSVAGILARCELDPRCLMLEITESVIMQDTEASLGVLHALGARVGLGEVDELQRAGGDRAYSGRELHPRPLLHVVAAAGEVDAGHRADAPLGIAQAARVAVDHRVVGHA